MRQLENRARAVGASYGASERLEQGIRMRPVAALEAQRLARSSGLEGAEHSWPEGLRLARGKVGSGR